MNSGPKLSEERVKYYSGKLVHSKDATAVRFLHNGQALNIITGELASKGSNVIYHPFYWNFTKETANEIAKELNVKPVFDKD